MPNGTYWWCERGEEISPTRFGVAGRHKKAAYHETGGLNILHFNMRASCYFFKVLL